MKNLTLGSDDLVQLRPRSKGERHRMASESSNDQVTKDMNFEEIIEENEQNEKKSKQVVRDWDERERLEEKIVWRIGEIHAR